MGKLLKPTFQWLEKKSDLTLNCFFVVNLLPDKGK